jgi:hypothetical protein
MTRTQLRARSSSALRVRLLPAAAAQAGQAPATLAKPADGAPPAPQPAGQRVDVDVAEMERACAAILNALACGGVLSTEARARGRARACPAPNCPPARANARAAPHRTQDALALAAAQIGSVDDQAAGGADACALDNASGAYAKLQRRCAWHAALGALVGSGHAVQVGAWYQVRWVSSRACAHTDE